MTSAWATDLAFGAVELLLGLVSSWPGEGVEGARHNPPKAKPYHLGGGAEKQGIGEQKQ